MNNQVKLLIFLFAGIIIIPLIIWGVVSLREQGTELVAVVVVPNDAKVIVKDSVYTGASAIRLKPGVYTVSVEKDGFETLKNQIVVRENDDSAAIIAALTPISEEAQEWYEKNQTAYTRLEGRAGELANKQGEAFIEKFPLTKWLPLQKAVYVIGYKEEGNISSDRSIVITIDANEGYREAALQEIRDLNFDPADYKIEFINYRNPFNE